MRKNLPLIQDTQLNNKLVLIRVDHNVVKKGSIKDPYRIDASIPTIKHILENGGKPILMSHIGRPRNKKTGEINISEKNSIEPVVEYLKDQLDLKIKTPQFKKEQGLEKIADLIDLKDLIAQLKSNLIDAIYLPNTRWFKGEEAKDKKKEILGKELASIADIFVNDAFGSWRPHASTYEPPKHIPGYAGLLMQKEIEHLSDIFSAEEPFLAVIAGSKFDTKIGPMTALLKKADNLIIGGVIYNAYLCAKYDFKIEGISDEEIEAAKKFIENISNYSDKIIELPFIVESDTLDEKIEGKYRTLDIGNLKKGKKLKYVLDIAKKSFETEKVKQTILNAKTIFVNAVMGYTPNFTEGTIAFDSILAKNEKAQKLLGGGDTLQEFKTLLPEKYQAALQDDKYYFFTGGGTILKAIKENSAYGLEPVKILLKDR